MLVTSTEPEPRAFGKQVVLGGILDHLVDRLGADAVTVVLVAPDGVDRPPVPYRLRVVAKPGALDQLRAVATRVVAGPHTSLQEAAVWSPRVGAEIARALTEVDADLEVYDTVRLGQYAPVPRTGRTRRVLYADDLFSIRYARMLEHFRASGAGASPVSEFRRMLPGPAGRVLDDPRAYRPLLALESRLVARSERRQPQRFDTTLLVSAEETATLRSRVPGADVRTLVPRLREPAARPRPDAPPPTFAFVGGLDYAPNADGLRWFLATCREQVLEALPDFRLLVVGPGTQRGLPEAEPWGDAVSFLGFVDDLGEVLAGCAALLSSLRVGTGVKIKVLEALARGLPVVATPTGLQGLDAGPAQGCLVGSTPAELAGALARAAAPAENRALSAAARRHWDERYRADRVAASYDAAFGLTPAPVGSDPAELSRATPSPAA